MKLNRLKMMIQRVSAYVGILNTFMLIFIFTNNLYQVKYFQVVSFRVFVLVFYLIMLLLFIIIAIFDWIYIYPRDFLISHYKDPFIYANAVTTALTLKRFGASEKIMKEVRELYEKIGYGEVFDNAIQSSIDK